jgi:hypothetical protein
MKKLFTTYTNDILAIAIDSPEQMRTVFDSLHSQGYNKEGLPLFNVWEHDLEYKRGMRFVMVYRDSQVVKMASSISRKNGRIKPIPFVEFDKEK